jgi:hypothetical protein
MAASALNIEPEASEFSGGGTQNAAPFFVRRVLADFGRVILAIDSNPRPANAASFGGATAPLNNRPRQLVMAIWPS